MSGDPFAQRKRENVAGYVIGMWHVEDLMRAYGFDIGAVERELVDQMTADQQAREAMLEWYADIIRRMQAEGLEQGGHLGEVNEVLAELEALHAALLETGADPTYNELLEQARSALEDLQRVAPDTEAGPIKTCFVGVYGVMVLRAKDKPVGPGTAEADGLFRRLLERLGMHYRQLNGMPGSSMN
jgi:hypothetical protein